MKSTKTLASLYWENYSEALPRIKVHWNLDFSIETHGFMVRPCTSRNYSTISAFAKMSNRHWIYSPTSKTNLKLTSKHLTRVCFLPQVKYNCVALEGNWAMIPSFSGCGPGPTCITQSLCHSRALWGWSLEICNFNELSAAAEAP